MEGIKKERIRKYGMNLQSEVRWEKKQDHMEGIKKGRIRKYGMNLLFLLHLVTIYPTKQENLGIWRMLKKQVLMPPRYGIVNYVLYWTFKHEMSN